MWPQGMAREKVDNVRVGTMGSMADVEWRGEGEIRPRHRCGWSVEVGGP